MGIEELREREGNIRSLLSNPYWKELEVIINGQLEARVQKVLLTPLRSDDETLEMEFCKGEYAAFKLILQYPQMELEGIMEETKVTLTEMENGND